LKPTIYDFVNVKCEPIAKRNGAETTGSLWKEEMTNYRFINQQDGNRQAFIE